MNEYTESFAPQGGGSPPHSSTAAVARDQAATVGRSASQAGGQVAQTAADQAREVASETARHARDLVGEASARTRDQASLQQQKAAHQLRAVAGELEEMAAKGGQSGLATGMAQEAAARIHGAASWLEQREPGDVLAAVRDFARRRPGVFLAGATVAGLAAGRLTRGMTAAARSGDQPGPQSQPAGEIPAAATIPPPPDPAGIIPTSGYPADDVHGTDAGTAPYYPAADAPSPRVPWSDEEAAAGQGYSVPADYPGDSADRAGYPEYHRGDSGTGLGQP